MTTVLIVGGAGFIGSNVAHRLLSMGARVRILDNLSRRHVERNLDWLHKHGGQLEVSVGDVRNRQAVLDAVDGASVVFHFAAQVAVTTSLSDPLADFEINAGGTLNVLEAIRCRTPRTPLIFTSTNKVYGALGHMALRSDGLRYVPVDADVARHGVDERQALDFYSPYGCSKGAADQYVLDYARIFGLRTVVLRMSCIYGPRQFGNEDQGWVAHFAARARAGEPITIYGDGRQVRDALFIDDLVDAMLLAHRHIERLSGTAFNMGGGPCNTMSLLELIDLLGRTRGARPKTEILDWRPGDQRYYVSDVRFFGSQTGWAPKTGLDEGIRRLCAWQDEYSVEVPTRHFVQAAGLS